MESSNSSTSGKSVRKPKNSIGVAIESKSVFEAIKEAERRGVNPNILMRASQAFRIQLYQLVESANVAAVEGRIGDMLNPDLPIIAANTTSATVSQSAEATGGNSRDAGNTAADKVWQWKFDYQPAASVHK